MNNDDTLVTLWHGSWLRITHMHFSDDSIFFNKDFSNVHMHFYGDSIFLQKDISNGAKRMAIPKGLSMMHADHTAPFEKEQRQASLK